MAFDLKVFNKQVYTARTELIDQQVQLFNAATSGGIMLSPSSDNQGDFAMEASFRTIAGLVRRRNVYNGTATVPPSRLVHLQNNSVKIAAGTPPIQFEPAQYAWILRDQAEAARVIGEQLAEATVADMLNTAISGAVGAIGAQSSLIHANNSATLNFADLVKGAGKFGDRQGSITVWIMHSNSLTELYLDAVNNSERLFVYGTVQVRQDPTGRLFVMTDSPALVDSTTPAAPKYKILGLVPGAVLVQTNNDFNMLLEEKTGYENIQHIYQSEWSYQLGLLGYSWDIATGGAAPNNAAIAAGANWERTASSTKDTAGVMVISGLTTP